MRRAWIVLVFATIARVMAPAQENSAMAGKWTLHYNIGGYEGELACNFAQTGNDVSGKCTAEQGTVAVSGKVEEKNVTLQYKADYNGEQLTVTYAGKLESSSKVTGSVSVQPMGAEGVFTATQSK